MPQLNSIVTCKLFESAPSLLTVHQGERRLALGIEDHKHFYRNNKLEIKLASKVPERFGQENIQIFTDF